MQHRSRPEFTLLLASLSALLAQGCGDSPAAGDAGRADVRSARADAAADSGTPAADVPPAAVDTPPPVDTPAAMDAPEATDVPPAPADAPAAEDHQRPDIPMYMHADAGVRPTGDAPTGPMCNGVAVEDLERLGTRSGNALRYVGNNNTASPSDAVGLQPNTVALQGRCPYRMNYARVFAYTTRAAGSLRVTTTGAMTSATFDSVLYVAPVASCGSSLGDFACNDNDPQIPDMSTGNHFTSRLGTGLLPMGTTVLIAVGGKARSTTYPADRLPRGTFELAVFETPAIADGAECARSRIGGVCAAGSSCAPAATGTGNRCARNGSVAGADCGAMNACASGLACDATANVCYRVLAEGMPCELAADAVARCGPSSTCVDPSLANFNGVCRPNGTLLARCGATGQCNSGLSCAPLGGAPTCLRTLARNARCSTADSYCPDGQACVPDQPDTFVGTCRDEGSVAGAPCMGDRCAGAGLRCATTEDPAVCVATANAGDPCDVSSRCVAGHACVAFRPDDRSRGRCYATGAEGGPCRLEAPLCNPGSTCSNTASPEAGRCVRQVAAGMACQPWSPTADCTAGSGCAPTPGTVNTGTCVAAGTVVGAPCRAASPRCDNALTCAQSIGPDGTCVAGSTAACDPWTLTTRCTATDASCRASSQFEGACAVPAEEVEPNDTPATAQRLTGASGFVHFDVDPGEIDCFSVDVPANGRVFARVARTASNVCSGFIRLEFIDPNGRLLGREVSSTPHGCPMINGPDTTSRPSMYAWARDLSAGRHTLCAFQQNGANLANADWVLSVNVTTPD